VSGVDRLHPGVVHHIVNTLGWLGLRPLQEAAIEPLADGVDALLLAPTAGGKTEAALFPLLTAMIENGWRGLSLLYVCPLRALLNNLHPRVDAYARWVGRSAEVWHGDIGQSRRRRMLVERPDILLTTPESLESLLVSRQVDAHEFFADLRAVIVDEVHAFAGDDRGWHLLAVLERVARLAHRPLQRIGLSATVGNPDELLHWLQGTVRRPGTVIAPPAAQAVPAAEVGLDYVGSIPNAATVIGALYQGEKRLVFCETRSQAEQLAFALRAGSVTTFVSHSSLSVDERRQAEHAFAEARDCVIVSTSTLELGIDVGDLDRVIQLDAPRTVASFLQRLGRTGRRPGASRNTLFLATRRDALLRAAGLLSLWQDGYIEPVHAPPSPRHIAAQQVLALCLQEGRVGGSTLPQWWGGLPVFDETLPEIIRWLVETRHLERDAGMLFIGPEAERRYGRRNFMELLTVFTAAPEFTVLHGRQAVGSTDPLMLMRKVDGPCVLSLGGRAWHVVHIDWARQRCYVEPADLPARSRWQGALPPESFELCQAQRSVLLGATPDVGLSQRAQNALKVVREESSHQVWDKGTVLEHRSNERWWWTWAGGRGNATLAAALDALIDPENRPDNHRLRIRDDVTPAVLKHALGAMSASETPAPAVVDDAVRKLKFSEILPPELATHTLAARLRDARAARTIARAPRRWMTNPGR
jgi:ATP-dependent Lhr-like helicase